jgi:hypothetical protein
VKQLLTLAVLFLVAIVSYLWWESQKSDNPIVRLSLFVDEHVDSILGPLPFADKGILASPNHTHHLRVLRENIRDLQKVSPTEESLRYTTAVQLCDQLIAASGERDLHLARINDVRAKSKPSPLFDYSEQHREERLAFFENGIALSWNEASHKLRKKIDYAYAKLRQFERSK